MKQSPKFILFLLLFFSFVMISSCDFNQNNIHHSKEYSISPDGVKQGDFYAKALSSTHLISNYSVDSSMSLRDKQHWRLTKDISKYPKIKSDYPILEAIYNMSLEELELHINKDSLFYKSEEKNEIKTRDISYNIILALAICKPEISKKSLMHKVKDGKIIQDSGTGGGWPINSDQVTWSIAAWEIYLTTGDKSWLKKAYRIIKKTSDDNLNVVWNYDEHLFKGESSFLDKRKQNYPQWMDAKDIFSSYSLSTQAIHYQNLLVLSKMGQILNHETHKYKHISNALKKSINKKLWLKEKKHYAQFKYDSNSSIVSEKTDNLGQSLCILFDIADDKQKKQIIENTVQLAFGIPCFYPQTPNIPTYYNNSIWPLVQAYWNWSSTKTDNDKSVEHGLSSLLRSSALFLSNKRNIIAETGNFKKTNINSNSQLGSITASLSSIFRVLLGLNFKEDHLQISPFIPREFKGELNIKNLKYRHSTLDIKILGFGNHINTFMIDSIPLNKNEISDVLKGHHKILIKMTNSLPYRSEIKLKKNSYSPQTPLVQLIDSNLVWQQSMGEKKYRVFRNGKIMQETKDSILQLPPLNSNSSYQVDCIDKNGNKSFLSKPILILPKNQFQIIETEWFTNQNKTYVELNDKSNSDYIFKIKVKESASYFIDFAYANSNGSTQSDNQCISRSLWVSHDYLGTIVFPQREDESNKWGYSNAIKINLKKGRNNLRLKLETFNKNQKMKNSTVLIDKIRIRRAN